MLLELRFPEQTAVIGHRSYRCAISEIPTARVADTMLDDPRRLMRN